MREQVSVQMYSRRRWRRRATFGTLSETLQTSEPSTASFRFGVFELFVRTGELRKNGVLVRLPPQPAQVLLLLVEHAGEVVTREEIQKLTWPADTVVDFEVGLNRCIRRIRSALLDDADAPRYVETVPRIGYRFIAPVDVRQPAVQSTVLAEEKPERLEEEPDGPDTQATGGSIEPIAPAKAEAEDGRRKVLIKTALLVAGGIVILRGALWLWSISVSSPAIRTGLEVVPLANDLGIANTPSFSPEGRQIAFVWNGPKQDNFDIYVKMVGSQEVVRLTTNPEIDYSPAWSPDGRFIAFCRGTDQRGGAIWLISPLGGAERKLVDIHASAVPDNRAISWSPDGRWLAYSDSGTADGPEELFLVGVESGEKRQLTFPSADGSDLFPSFSPDGHTLAYTRDTGRGVSTIHLLPFQADGTVGKPVVLLWRGFEATYCARPAWTTDGKQIVFASNRTGEHHLWVVNANQTAQPELLESLGGNVKDAAISTGGKLAFVRETFDPNIWKIDLGRLRKKEPASPVRVVASTLIESNPRVSPDGRKIAFESNGSGFMEIWTANRDGSEAIEITSMRNPVTGSPAWSNDGRHIAFDSRAEGAPRIYVIPAEGGTPVAITGDSSRSVVPNWSPDDAWIYFSSDRTGSSEIWRMPAKGGGEERLTRNGGFAAMPSPDGLYLYYTADRVGVSVLRRLNLATKEETEIAQGVLRRGYFATNDGVYYISGGPFASQSLNFFKTTSGSTEMLLKLEKPVADGIALSPDGRDLFYSQIDYSGSDLMLVKNFGP
jgi:Tol biopolymer transport system component/DNA-binding winged helix-turn-helix (wHTH) protein